MRILTGAFCHETSTFTTVPTTWDNYHNERFGFLRGDALLDKFHNTNSPIGGFMAGAEAHGFDLIPTLYANPQPSAPTPRSIFDAILNEMLERMAAAGPVDGVLLELHGSMVAEGIDDGEGHILAAVRDLVGPTVPILAQLDIHANVSQRMVEKADVLIGRETYPEVDQAARGRECADVLVGIVKEGLRPTMALHQVPLVWGMNQVTAHSPMREAIAALHRIEEQPNVICGSLSTCYPLADVPDMGASVYIVADNDQVLAQRYADELGAWIWERRADWHTPMPSTQEALTQVGTAGNFPVIFADRNDNPGGGSPSDSTGMLRTFIEAGLQDACLLYIVDPEAVDQCQQAGVGEMCALKVGGKSSPMQGEPIDMRAEVVALSDGHFRYDGPRNAGLAGDMGPSAHIVQDGIHVLLVTKREQPFDTAFARTLGLVPQQMRYIGVKSTAHFRAGFEAWAGAIVAVSEPSVHDPITGTLAFEKLGRKVYPFDEV
ncbi:MAG: M81 family metallopeptidase [Chloroflexota bacterium]